MRSLLRRYEDFLRWLYRGGRPNRVARLQNQLSALLFAAGIGSKHATTLELRGWRSGRSIAFPLVIADYQSERYAGGRRARGPAPRSSRDCASRGDHCRRAVRGPAAVLGARPGRSSPHPS